MYTILPGTCVFLCSIIAWMCVTGYGWSTVASAWGWHGDGAHGPDSTAFCAPLYFYDAAG